MAQAKPKEKEYNLSDGQGLQLRIKPNGSKLWLFNYTHPYTKKRQNISLGSYPTVTLAQARDKRRINLELLEQDIDPKTHKKEQIQAKALAANNTFEAVAKRWIEIHKSKVQEATAKKIWRSLENDVFPLLGSYPINQITAPLAIEVLSNITGRNSYETARKVARRLNNVMVFAVNSGLTHHNPLTGIKEMIPSSKVENYPTLLPEELPELMHSLNFANIKFATRCLIEWQLHTMVRPGEAVGAKWHEIDWNNKLWIIPAERMKMDKPHQVPLSHQAMNILGLLKPYSAHREHIFPSYKDPKNHCSKETSNTALKRMGFKGRLVAHGMRALASTTLNEQGFDPDVIESALAHTDKDQVRAAYNRATYLERRKTMMQWWSDHIEQAAQGSMSLANAKRNLKVVTI